jgi:hypothetical protein
LRLIQKFIISLGNKNPAKPSSLGVLYLAEGGLYYHQQAFKLFRDALK